MTLIVAVVFCEPNFLDPPPSPPQDIIIKALYKSIEYFEEWNRSRMQTYLSVLIADEYAASKDFQKAVTLYNKCLTCYEKEKWTPLVNHLKERISIFEESKSP
jgi:hypothetical protein